jgi:hypothetical protein
VHKGGRRPVALLLAIASHMPQDWQTEKGPDPIEEAMAHIPEALWCNENLNAVKYHLLDSTPNIPSFFYQDFLPSKTSQ